MATALAFDQAPPISVPLRFFLTAPIFGMAAGLLLVIFGGEVLFNRWHPVTLALTHLMVVGFMLQVMMGALFQFVPVVTGGNVFSPLRSSRWIHLCVTLGASILALAFLAQLPHLFVGAALYLGLGIGAGILLIGRALWPGAAHGETLGTLRGAIVSLVPTLGLGMLLALTLGGEVSLEVPRLLMAHQAWGLAGWSLLLLAGVSWAVVPMFQVTPPYPRALVRSFMPILLCTLVLMSVGLMAAWPVWVTLAQWVGWLAALAYGVTTLRLQARSRRKKGDATRRFFRLAMGCLLAACGLGAALLLAGDSATLSPWQTLLGMLLIMGVFGSAMGGMLYKIVPFLIWLHLQGHQTGQERAGSPALPLNMNQIIPPTMADRQFWLHGVACACLFPSPWLPFLGHWAGVCLLCSWGYLLRNLWMAMAVYRRHRPEAP